MEKSLAVEKKTRSPQYSERTGTMFKKPVLFKKKVNYSETTSLEGRS